MLLTCPSKSTAKPGDPGLFSPGKEIIKHNYLSCAFRGKISCHRSSIKRDTFMAEVHLALPGEGNGVNGCCCCS